MKNRAVINLQKKFSYFVYLNILMGTLLLSKSLFAAEYQLKLIVDLSEIENVSTDASWLDPIANPASNNEFFVAQDNGVIFSVDSNNSSKNILNVAQSLDNQTFISLSALVFHPSFAKPEEAGYATIFTAHTGKFNQETRRNILIPKDKDMSFVFDFETVITAWKYDFDTQEIDPTTQREVLRIPIQNKESGIQKLAFDPFQKQWNPDYGQLYFSLNYQAGLQQYPLYSGTILRIHPLTFGARNYTVSASNPFIKEPKISNEVVLLNGQSIEDFYWTKIEHASIFVQHNNGNQHRLSRTSLGDDLIKLAQTNSLWQQSKPLSSMLLYQGRNILNLRNRLVYFTLINDRWHLSSRTLDSISGESSVFDGLIEAETLTADAKLRIHQDNKGEIILFDNKNSRMYSIQLGDIPQDELDTPIANPTESGEGNYLLYLVLLVAAGLVLVVVTRKKSGKSGAPKSSLVNEYVRYRYEPTTHNLLLFKSQRKNDHKTLAIKDVTGCELLLNGKVINTLDAQSQNVFNNQIERDLRAAFIEEISDTSHDQIARHIEVIFSRKDEQFPVSVYLREGNIRITGTKYYEAVDTLMEICWIISKRVHPKATEARILPKTVRLARQSAIKPKQAIVEDASILKTSLQPAAEIKEPESEKIQEDGHIQLQTGVVDSLDKLVNLHQKGYLSDEEFKAAKIKVLQNL